MSLGCVLVCALTCLPAPDGILLPLFRRTVSLDVLDQSRKVLPILYLKFVLNVVVLDEASKNRRVLVYRVFDGLNLIRRHLLDFLHLGHPGCEVQMFMFAFVLQLLEIGVNCMQEMLDLVETRLGEALILLHLALKLCHDVFDAHFKLSLLEVHFVENDFHGFYQFLVIQSEVLVGGRHVEASSRQLVEGVDVVIIEDRELNIFWINRLVLDRLLLLLGLLALLLILYSNRAILSILSWLVLVGNRALIRITLVRSLQLPVFHAHCAVVYLRCSAHIWKVALALGRGVNFLDDGLVLRRAQNGVLLGGRVPLSRKNHAFGINRAGDFYLRLLLSFFPLFVLHLFHGLFSHLFDQPFDGHFLAVVDQD